MGGYGLGLPAVGLPVAPLVAHPNGAVTPDYTPAQKLAAADHFAKGGGRVHALPLLAGHAIWKREAEAAPTTDLDTEDTLVSATVSTTDKKGAGNCNPSGNCNRKKFPKNVKSTKKICANV